MPTAWLLLAGAVLFNVASYVVYKRISGLPPQAWWPLFIGGQALGGLNTYFFARAIEDIELSIAYPLFSGACFALITLASVMLFAERLRTISVVGLLFVVVGIVLVAQGAARH